MQGEEEGRKLRRALYFPTRHSGRRHITQSSRRSLLPSHGGIPPGTAFGDGDRDKQHTPACGALDPFNTVGSGSKLPSCETSSRVHQASPIFRAYANPRVSLEPGPTYLADKSQFNLQASRIRAVADERRKQRGIHADQANSGSNSVELPPKSGLKRTFWRIRW